MRYTADSRDRVRDAADMLTVVSSRTDLRRAGATEYVGLCPFHEERTPSFGVNPEEKVYHCFGCQASGDVFTFVMETEGLDFTAALEALADRFGVQLEREAEDPQAATRRQRRERLHSLLARAAAYYARYLWEASEASGAHEYLRRRSLSDETLREFRIGYAPSAWDRMLSASRRAGFSDEELLAVGLVQRSRANPGRLHDRFREQIMFPATDARGHVLGFGARAMRPGQHPKYLNTSDGELYHKRSQLFGIDLARAPAARAGRIILAEGYTDVLALHQAGLRNAVGIMGTSLTEDQVKQLERIAPVLELCLDADRAGQEAMLRAARLAAGRKLQLRVVPLPEGSDPAELLERESAEALRALIERSQPFAAFHVERILRDADASSAEGRDRALQELAPVVAEVPASVLRDELLRRIGGHLELSEGRLAALLANGERRGMHPLGRPEPPRLDRAAEPVVDQALRAERAFLVLCVTLPQAGADALAAVDPDELLTIGVMRRAARHLAARTHSPLAELPEGDQELAGAVADIVARADRAREASTEQLEHARLVLERARIERAIRRARAQRSETIGELARQREDVLASIRRVVARLEAAV